MPPGGEGALTRATGDKVCPFIWSVMGGRGKLRQVPPLSASGQSTHHPQVICLVSPQIHSVPRLYVLCTQGLLSLTIAFLPSSAYSRHSENIYSMNENFNPQLYA